MAVEGDGKGKMSGEVLMIPRAPVLHFLLWALQEDDMIVMQKSKPLDHT
jgi:hypothetical protein